MAKRLHGLDALRGIAALIVFWFHMHQGLGFPHLFPSGFLAVDFFFMLSGYVLARTYDARAPRTADFVAKRYARLWPWMAIGGLLGLIALLHGSPLTWALLAAVAANLVLLPAPWLGAFSFPLNAVAWSVYFELVCNAAHFSLMRRAGWVAVASGIIFAAAVLWFGTSDLGSGSKWVIWGIPRALFSYSAGVWLWRRWGDEPPRVPTFTIALLPLVCALHGTRWTELAMPFIVAPLLIAGGVRFKPSKGLVALGAISFPLYALHWPIVGAVGAFGLPSALPLALIPALLAEHWWRAALQDGEARVGDPATGEEALPLVVD